MQSCFFVLSFVCSKHRKGEVVKAKIGELEEEVRAGFSIRMRNELTGVVQGISGKKRFLVRFQDGCKNYLTSNQITIMIVEKSPVEKEPGMPTNPDIHEEKVTSYKVPCSYYSTF